MNHCSSPRLTTGVPQRQQTPSPTTCSFARTVLQSSHQFDGGRACGIQVLFIELEKSPLVPFIVIDVACLYPASPVITVACSLELIGHMFDIAHVHSAGEVSFLWPRFRQASRKHRNPWDRGRYSPASLGILPKDPLWNNAQVPHMECSAWIGEHLRQ